MGQLGQLNSPFLLLSVYVFVLCPCMLLLSVLSLFFLRFIKFSPVLTVPNTALLSALHCVSDKSIIWIIAPQFHSTIVKHD